MALPLLPVACSYYHAEQRELLEFQLQEFKLNEETKLGLDDHPLYTNISLVTGITDQLLQIVIERAGQLYTVDPKTCKL